MDRREFLKVLPALLLLPGLVGAEEGPEVVVVKGGDEGAMVEAAPFRRMDSSGDA